MPFVYNSWINSARNDHMNMRKSVFVETFLPSINNILEYSKILIACDDVDPNFIIGYIVYSKIDDIVILHWAYTKEVNRKMGVFKALVRELEPRFPDEPVVATYKSDKRQKLFDKYKIVYKPELRRVYDKTKVY